MAQNFNIPPQVQNMGPASLVDDQTLSYQVELFISCQNLKNMDVLTLSDPQVLVYASTGPQKSNFVEIGRTEMISNNLNPKFTKTITMKYFFEKTQHLRFDVLDIDAGTPTTSNVNDNDFIGSMSCTLADICGAKGQKITKPILSKNNAHHGFMTIHAEEVSQCQDEVILQFKGTKLAKKDFFGKSDPYFILSKTRESGGFLDLYKSEVLKVTLNPVWQPFKIRLSKLCNNDYRLPLRFQCYDWNRIMQHSVIGELQIDFQHLLEYKAGFQLIEKTKNGKQKAAGTITCEAQLIKKYGFLQYLLGGLEMNLIVGIDFTASNGNPNDPNSLHYMGNMNQYERAIRAVGDILSAYDTDKKFPVYGFGAKLPPSWQEVSHCFAVNGNHINPECDGIDGVLQAYRQALFSVRLNGPTLFAPIINEAVNRFASDAVNQYNQKYYILLMITDGEINDMDDTIAAVIRASRTPMSIIIVGVGNGSDFENMKQLDGDNGLLKSGNQVAARDIVQFVPFSKFANLDYSALAEETLAEIPHQVSEFFGMMNIKPREAIRVQTAANINNLMMQQQQQQQQQVYPPQPVPVPQQQQEPLPQQMVPQVNVPIQYPAPAPALAPVVVQPAYNAQQDPNAAAYAMQQQQYNAPVVVNPQAPPAQPAFNPQADPNQTVFHI